ncbi:ParA family protein [Priestia megaterium]|uniref:ParA family protein n=1 Tax=Priestia megaterium TaxID=1404 RepID=UPI00215A2652|nr:ParA family protein [Priestia megaterium]MCR8866886.1 ParA family protein [Priestia megaterium]
MTPVISFLNMKGGVGKSTLCFNIAYTIANHFKKRVLVLDMDPQFNTTQALIEKYYNSEAYIGLVEEEKTVLRVFQGQKSIIQRGNEDNDFSPEDIILELEENLSLICGNLDLIMVESSQRGTENLLDSFIRKIVEKNDYEYIFIDCPPTYSFYTTSSLIASNYYFAPVKPDMYSVLGVDLLSSVIRNVNSINRANVSCLGMIFTLVRNSATQRRIIDSLKEKNKNIKVFESEMTYFQYSESGRIDTFMYDMDKTKAEIIEIAEEFMNELESKKRS